MRKGGDSLSWMTLWANNQYWFNAAGTVGVAYQPHNGVAVTVGGPIGEPGTTTAPLMSSSISARTNRSLPAFIP
ncbi:phosphatidylglycerol lysyltransferase domain-containing protein [Arthrobacter alpinus]|nr:phosphatidylglycerol lysyltransferase domain-containing protein [Arthrobacter alpinus]